jgi:hypothetical protein
VVTMVSLLHCTVLPVVISNKLTGMSTVTLNFTFYKRYKIPAVYKKILII